MVKVIYKNKDFVIVEKPCGMLSQKDVNGENGLVEILAEQLGGEIYPVHRLDRPVGGVMVYARNKKSAAMLSADGAFDKTYLAVVSGIKDEFPIAGEMIDYLYKDGAKGKSFVVKKERRGAKYARLTYEIIANVETEQGRLSLLSVRLYTGRTHQIRVQLSSRGMPIVGDGKYGSRIKSENVALWSHKIEINAPVSCDMRVFTSIPGSGTAFDKFEIK